MGINPQYLQESVKKDAADFFRSQDIPSVVLMDFLEEKEYEDLAKNLKDQPFVKDIKPMHHSYATFQTALGFLESKEFQEYLKEIIGKNGPITGKVYSFSWKDYTILHDSEQEEEGYDIIYDLTEDWDTQAGGLIVYSDGEGNSINFPIMRNMLILVKRSKGVHRFVQYVNHYGKGKAHKFFLGSIPI